MKDAFIASVLPVLLFVSAGCGSGEGASDAYGNFEATETLISAEANGRLLRFDITAGQRLTEGYPVGLIDTTQLALKRAQLLAMRTATASRTANIRAQIDVLEEQRAVAVKEKNRLERLLEDGAATEKQLDDVLGQIRVIDRKIQSIRTQNAPVLGELGAIDAQIAQLEDQLRKCRIVNPVNGTVLETYARLHEVSATGRPLYKIANLDTLILRAYVSGLQLREVFLGQRVDVLIDEADGSLHPMKGVVSWIAAEAEFTPKMVQTRDERVDLVYAIEVRVENSDGMLKIGLPGEVRFPSDS